MRGWGANRGRPGLPLLSVRSAKCGVNDKGNDNNKSTQGVRGPFSGEPQATACCSVLRLHLLTRHREC